MQISKLALQFKIEPAAADRRLRAAIVRSGGELGKVAEVLNVSRKTLWRLMKKNKEYKELAMKTQAGAR